MAPISLHLHRIRQQGQQAAVRVRRTLSANGLGDRPFLHQVHRFERQLAKLLAAALIVVLVVATAELLVTLGAQLFGGGSRWFGEDMTRFLDQILALSSAYWLVRQSHTSRSPTRREPASGFPEPDRSPQPGDAAQG